MFPLTAACDCLASAKGSWENHGDGACFERKLFSYLNGKFSNGEVKLWAPRSMKPSIIGRSYLFTAKMEVMQSLDVYVGAGQSALCVPCTSSDACNKFSVQDVHSRLNTKCNSYTKLQLSPRPAHVHTTGLPGMSAPSLTDLSSLIGAANLLTAAQWCVRLE